MSFSENETIVLKFANKEGGETEVNVKVSNQNPDTFIPEHIASNILLVEIPNSERNYISIQNDHTFESKEYLSMLILRNELKPAIIKICPSEISPIIGNRLIDLF